MTMKDRIREKNRKIMKTAKLALITGLVLALSLAAALLAGCGQEKPAEPADSAAGGAASGDAAEAPSTKLVIGAAQVPHAEILEFIKPTLAKQGVELEIVVPTSEEQLNQLTENGELDVNYFQHKPYLDSVVAEKGYDLVSVGGIHIEPIGAYSDTYTSKDQIPDDATVAVPNDGTNEYRALKILEKAGFITLKASIDPATTTKGDIESYLKPLNIVELEAGLIVRTHDEYDLYISNTNRIIEGGLDPNTNLFREGADSPYANIIVVKSGRANDEAVKALYDALRTPDVKKFIEDTYNGAVVPTF
jgi:D-methionine transport system substrate-binding protein